MAEFPKDFKQEIEAEALHFAAADGNLAAVRNLVESGIPINAFDDMDWTPLHHAANNGHIDIVRFLLDAGADVNAHNAENAGNTVLASVAETCSYDMAEILVAYGADPGIPGWMQLTALHRCANRKRGDGPKVKTLLEQVAVDPSAAGIYRKKYRKGA